MRKVNTIVKTSDINKLKAYYVEALKDDKFREYINNIDLNDEVLMKYTSNIEDAIKEENNCNW